MNKKETIQHIQALRQSEAFSSFFTNEDFETICKNVENDDYIFESLSIYKDYNDSVGRTVKENSTLKTAIQKIADLCTKGDMVHSSEIRKTIEPILGQKYFIALVLKNSVKKEFFECMDNLLNLRQEDINYLLDMLSKY